MSNQRKSTKGILIYNLLLKEVSKINKLLPEDRKMSLSERRSWISKKLYPKYKDQARSRIRLTPLRDTLYKKIKRLPKKIGCDVLALNPLSFQDIPYFEIESFLSDVLPKCIYVKVNAGDFGETPVFNTRDFNYYSSGVADITNRLNEYCRRHDKDTSSIPEYSGIIRLRSKKKNDGIPDNYFLEMILIWDERSKPKQQLQIPYKKKTKKQETAESNIKKYVMDRAKTVKNQKSSFRPIRKKIDDKFSFVERHDKEKKISKEEKRRFKKEAKKELVAYVKKKVTTGKITPTKSRIYIKRINQFFSRWKG